MFVTKDLKLSRKFRGENVEIFLKKGHVHGHRHELGHGIDEDKDKDKDMDIIDIDIFNYAKMSNPPISRCKTKSSKFKSTLKNIKGIRNILIT